MRSRSVQFESFFYSFFCLFIETKTLKVTCQLHNRHKTKMVWSSLRSTANRTVHVQNRIYSHATYWYVKANKMMPSLLCPFCCMYTIIDFSQIFRKRISKPFLYHHFIPFSLIAMGSKIAFQYLHHQYQCNIFTEYQGATQVHRQ